MTPLCDWQIEELCQGENPMISPFFNHKISEEDGRKILSKGLSHYGYDVTLAADDVRVFVKRPGMAVDPKNFNEDCLESLTLFGADRSRYFLIPRKSSVLAYTVERFRIPQNIIVECVGKSTYARAGIMMNVTPAEPGWRGQLVLEFYNSNPNPVVVYANEGIAQLVFFEGNNCLAPYEGKYQNQSKLTFAKV